MAFVQFESAMRMVQLQAAWQFDADGRYLRGCHNPVASRLFCLIEGLVRSLDQISRGGMSVGNNARVPDADRDDVPV